MSDPNDLTSMFDELGDVRPLTPWEIKSARIHVAAHAHNPDDHTDLLAALGLGDAA